MNRMIRSARTSGPRLRRSLTAALAVLALVYAATVAAAIHSSVFTAPTQAGMLIDHGSHSGSHSRGDAAVMAEAGHAGHQAHHNSSDPPAKAPCDLGCTLCKDCALCSMTTVAAPVVGPALPPQKAFALANAGPPASHISPPASEPPRV